MIKLSSSRDLQVTEGHVTSPCVVHRTAIQPKFGLRMAKRIGPFEAPLGLAIYPHTANILTRYPTS
jgi:hypothetical protein